MHLQAPEGLRRMDTSVRSPTIPRELRDDDRRREISWLLYPPCHGPTDAHDDPNASTGQEQVLSSEICDRAQSGKTPRR